MITLTPIAARKLLDNAKSDDIQATLRAGVRGGGCAGYSYFFEFIEPAQVNDTDSVFEQDGIKIYVDMLSLQYLDGMCIDYIEDGLTNTGFKFNNPNSKSTCGCGSSFSA